LNGQGEDARDYAALIRLEDLVELLIKAGYKDMKAELKDEDIKRCKQCGEWTINDPCKWCEDQ
jgi:recombinational DNA repair protein RecR